MVCPAAPRVGATALAPVTVTRGRCPMRACGIERGTGRRRRGEQRGAWHVGAADHVGTMVVGSRCVHPLSSRTSSACAVRAGHGPAPTTPVRSTKPWCGRASCTNRHHAIAPRRARRCPPHGTSEAHHGTATCRHGPYANVWFDGWGAWIARVSRTRGRVKEAVIRGKVVKQGFLLL